MIPPCSIDRVLSAAEELADPGEPVAVMVARVGRVRAVRLSSSGARSSATSRRARAWASPSAARSTTSSRPSPLSAARRRRASPTRLPGERLRPRRYRAPPRAPLGHRRASPRGARRERSRRGVQPARSPAGSDEVGVDAPLAFRTMGDGGREPLLPSLHPPSQRRRRAPSAMLRCRSAAQAQYSTRPPDEQTCLGHHDAADSAIQRAIVLHGDAIAALRKALS